VLIIGESINSTRRSVGEAISRRDEQFIRGLASKQVAAGAAMLDVNVGVAEGDEVQNLTWAVRTVQQAVDVPLLVDSGNPEALRAAFEVHRGRPILNSINGEADKLAALLPLAAEYECGAILLCLDDRGIPKTADERYQIAEFLVERAVQAGLPPERLYVDPLIMTVGSDSRAARVALDALCRIREGLPQVHTSAGITNVSFGMPQRSLLNRTLLAMAIAYGLDAFLVNVMDPAMVATIQAADTLMGNDAYCSNFLDAYHAGKLAN
jgi:cobalamin-dependent methionine synthase I